MKTKALIPLVVLVVGMAACGDDSGGSSSVERPLAPESDASDTDSSIDGGLSMEVPDVDACALLTDEEINDAFQADGSSPAIVEVTRENIDAPGNRSCDFAWTDASEGQSSFGLYVYGPDTYAGLKSAGSAEEVPGSNGALVNFDGVFDGNSTATVSITGMSDDAASASLVEAALAKLD